MSEPAIYKRKTKSGIELPGVTLEELQAMKRAGQKLQPDELVQVIGVRSFVSDERWLPASDYPELSGHFPEVSGRAIIEREVKRAKTVRLYAFAALAACILAAFLCWWMPYRDADDARGSLGRVTGELALVRKDSAEQAVKIKAFAEEAQRKEVVLQKVLADERGKLDAAKAQLNESLAEVSKLKGLGAAAASSLAELKSLVAGLNRRLAESEQLPKFWPGAEVLRAPANASQVRIVSCLLEKGYIYVVGSTRYSVGSLLSLKQHDLYGAKIQCRVASAYEHGNGDSGMALQITEYDQEAIKRLSMFSLGDVVDSSPVFPVK